MTIKMMKKQIKYFIGDVFDYSFGVYKKYAEIQKFRDERRVAIYSKIHLTKKQKASIDKLYLENYGKKIPYTWHRYYTAYTGDFDKYYFPELLYLPEFQRFMNGNSQGHTSTFSDKNILPLLAHAVNVRIPETIYSCINGIIQDSHHNIISLESVCRISGEYFIKPTVDSCSGNGCQVVNVENGRDTLSNKSIRSIIKTKGNNWVIQQRIRCHSSIANIYPNSVNTFRIMTYIWKNEICHVPIILRIGQGGSHLDNAHAGGMFIAIDDNGILHNTAFTEFKQEFTEHPNTHMKFKGYKIDLLPAVLDAAIKCHSYIPQIGCINWDFTIDNKGNPVLIEANFRMPGIWVFQMAHGCGPFGKKTPEILRWMKLMKHTKKSERYKYSYGKMNDD